MWMDLRPGVTVIDAAAADGVVEAAASGEVPVYVVVTGELAGRERFFDAVRGVLPLDSPLAGSRIWDALSDSLWEGIRGLDSGKVVILWPDAGAFKKVSKAEYELAVSIFSDIAESLADLRSTSGRPKEVSVFVGS